MMVALVIVLVLVVLVVVVAVRCGGVCVFGFACVLSVVVALSFRCQVVFFVLMFFFSL